MKISLFILFLILALLSSCTKAFIQVFDTEATQNLGDENGFIYETDTVKITYAFWAEKGLMSFTIYKELNKPIYIDWKKSAFINNDLKMDYWIDEVLTNITGQYRSYYYAFPLASSSVSIGANKGVQSASANTIKPEKITFIPPKSKYNRKQFYLYPVNYYKFDDTASPLEVNRNDKPTKTTKIFAIGFSYDTTPLKFRNYLAIQFSENSEQVFFIDNEFYLKFVCEMDKRHFNGKCTGYDKDGCKIYERPYRKGTSFYISLPTGYSTLHKNISKYYGFKNDWE
jgi:hypothetical protein